MMCFVIVYICACYVILFEGLLFTLFINLLLPYWVASDKTCWQIKDLFLSSLFCFCLLYFVDSSMIRLSRPVCSFLIYHFIIVMLFCFVTLRSFCLVTIWIPTSAGSLPKWLCCNITSTCHWNHWSHWSRDACEGTRYIQVFYKEPHVIWEKPGLRSLIADFFFPENCSTVWWFYLVHWLSIWTGNDAF